MTYPTNVGYFCPVCSGSFLTNKAIMSERAILLTRLRCDKSALGDHLHQIQCQDDPTCSCGLAREIRKHYLLNCANYSQQRIEMLRSLPNDIIDSKNLERILLHGDPRKDGKTNLDIITAVQQFIINTKRFD